MTDVDNIRIAFDEGSLLTLKVVLAALLFGIALDTRVADFKEAFRRPKAIAVGIAAQFLVLPGLVFLLTLLLDVRGSVALGMLLVACCPPGNVSNILTHRAKGDVALSVSMTAVGNVIAIFAMAPLFAFWGGLHPTGSTLLQGIELNAWDVLSEILVVIGIPFVLGLTIANLRPAFATKASKIVGPVAFLALGAIILISLTGNWDIFVNYIMIVMIAVVLQDALSLGLGYGIARVTGLPSRSRKAMTFEVGIRNSGLGLVLIFTFYGGLGGMALVAAWWGIWDIIAGLIVAQLWARRTKDEPEPVVAPGRVR